MLLPDSRLFRFNGKESEGLHHALRSGCTLFMTKRFITFFWIVLSRLLLVVFDYLIRIIRVRVIFIAFIFFRHPVSPPACECLV